MCRGGGQGGSWGLVFLPLCGWGLPPHGGFFEALVCFPPVVVCASRLISLSLCSPTLLVPLPNLFMSVTIPHPSTAQHCALWPNVPNGWAPRWGDIEP